jgi:hypothetical protein
VEKTVTISINIERISLTELEKILDKIEEITEHITGTHVNVNMSDTRPR